VSPDSIPYDIEDTKEHESNEANNTPGTSYINVLKEQPASYKAKKD